MPVLEGLDRLLRNKAFTPCIAVSEAVEKYKLESDSVRLFIEDNDYEKSADNKILLKHLYLEYRQYCNEDGYAPLNKKNFRRRVEGQGIIFERYNDGINVCIERKTVNPF